MSETDPDPYLPPDEQSRSELAGVPEPDTGDPTLGGKEMPGDGDPTMGGRTGQIGEAPSIAADEPDDGQGYPVGGGLVTEETNDPPVPDPGPGT